MTRAGKWADIAKRYHEDKRPSFVRRISPNEGGARVTDEGNLSVHFDTLTPSEVLLFASWLLDTFGEDAP